LEREVEARNADAVAVDVAEDEEARQRAIKEFEAVQNGLEGRANRGGAAVTKLVERSTQKMKGDVGREDAEEGGVKKKRKFELDEGELLRIAQEERAKARKTLGDEKVRFLRFKSRLSSL